MHAARGAGLGEVQKLRRDSVVEGTKMWSRDLGATWRLAAIAVVTGCLLGGCTASVPNQMPDTSEQYGVSPAAGSPTSTRGATPPADHIRKDEVSCAPVAVNNADRAGQFDTANRTG